MPTPPFQSAAVQSVFDGFDDGLRPHLMALRGLIFETAASMPEVGALEETLKWGQPAYLTSQTKSGSTIRLGAPKKGGYAMFAHCQTSLISDFQHIHPDGFVFDGNRAVLFDANTAPPLNDLTALIRAALTYHL